jgi:hypothetical protein
MRASVCGARGRDNHNEARSGTESRQGSCKQVQNCQHSKGEGLRQKAGGEACAEQGSYAQACRIRGKSGCPRREAGDDCAAAAGGATGTKTGYARVAAAGRFGAAEAVDA